MTEDRGQKTEDRGQRAKGKGKRTKEKSGHAAVGKEMKLEVGKIGAGGIEQST